MDMQLVAGYLNRTRGLHLDAGYYTRVREWQDWWRGFYEPFHRFREKNGGHTVTRELYSMKMAKKICEDWASILLNEKTGLALEDPGASVFLQGEDGAGGILGETGFWQHMNALVEQAFYSGTGAVVLRLEKLRLDRDGVLVPDPGTRLGMEYLPAMNILPLSVKQGRVVDVAFLSEVLERGERRVYLETHCLEKDGYVITNEYLGLRQGALAPAPLPPGLAARVETRARVPLFALLRPNVVNCIDPGCGLGMSIYAQALDNLKGVDLGFNNFCRDFKLGGKKVFYNPSLLGGDAQGGGLTPDDVCQQLFVELENRMPSDPQLIHEHNPALRVAENAAGIQAQLDYLSFKCGLGAKHYRFDNGTLVTATQYVGDRQELIQNASKHTLVLRRALQEIFRALLWAGREALGAPVDPDTRITLRFDDSVIVDKEAERARDREDVRDRIMQRWEYRMKWYGENEEQARRRAGGDAWEDEKQEGDAR